MTTQPRTTVKIGPHTIGDGHPVCIVAELGVNHLGDFERMKDMIASAHEAGADMLKFQTYLAEERYDRSDNPKADQFIKWLADWQFTRDQETELWEYAKKIGATVFTSIFDLPSLEFAESLGCVGYKIAAFEIVNKPLVAAIAGKGKPVVFSRGMATMDETATAVELIRENGTEPVVLHTISSYPLRKRDSHLRMIHTLRDRFTCPIGHSDHTVGADIPPLAVACGANMIEKHFTVNPKLRESDNFFSITADDLREMIFRVRQTETFMGRGDITRIETEDFMWDFRRERAS